MTESTTLAWFCRDLRLEDNPTWAAIDPATATTALFVVDPALFDRCGPFRAAQLLDHLHALDRSLIARGGRLRIESGDPRIVVQRVAPEIGAGAVHVHADVTPCSRRRDDEIEQALDGRTLRRCWGSPIHEPGCVLTAKRSLSLAFTPFSKAWFQSERTPWPEGRGLDRIASLTGNGLTRSQEAPFQTGGEEAALDRLAAW